MMRQGKVRDAFCFDPLNSSSSRPSPLQAKNLLPDMNQHVPLTAMRHQINQSFFKRGVDLVDGYGGIHKLTYECLVSAGQRHARLSAGWGPTMRSLQARIGDTIFLHLYGDRNDGVLHVRLERAGEA